MGAYDYMDQAVEGLKYGLDSKIEGGWACKESAGIGFGKPVFGYVDDEKGAYNYHNDTAKVAYDADFVTSNSIAFSVNGEAITPEVFDTDHDTTMTNLITAVNALDGVEAVLDADDVNNRTLLVRTKGTDCTVVTVVTLGASQAVATITYSSSQVFVGVAMFVQKTPTGYELYDSVNVMVDGEIWVVPTKAVEAQDDAYIDNTGADVGSFSDATSGHEKVNAVYRSSASASGLARLEVNGQTKFTYSTGRF